MAVSKCVFCLCILLNVYFEEVIVNYESEKNPRTARLISIWKLVLTYQIQIFIFLYAFMTVSTFMSGY